jgi:hypothetical protein
MYLFVTLRYGGEYTVASSKSIGYIGTPSLSTFAKYFANDRENTYS